MLRTLIAELRAVSPIVYAILLGLVLAGAFVATHQDWRLYQRLADDGMHVQGWVTGKDLIGGKRVDYAFRLGDKTYSGSSVAGYGNPPFSELKTDDEVIVFFLPKDPAVSALGVPKEHVDEQHKWEAWALILLLPALAIGVFGELKRHG